MMHILFEDADIIVINKMANVPSQKDFSRTPDVQSFANSYTKHECFLIHRLDRHVAGPIVLAKTKSAVKSLNDQLTLKSKPLMGVEQDGFTKEYLAVVMNISNKIIEEETTISLVHYQKKEKNLAITIDEDTYEKLPKQLQPDYKRACLNYTVVEKKFFGTRELLMLRIDLLTGRYHQIRSQLAYVGFPILGDPKYNSSNVYVQLPEDHVEEELKKIGLQAIKLGFKHPKSQKQVVFETTHQDYPFNLFLNDKDKR